MTDRATGAPTGGRTCRPSPTATCRRDGRGRAGGLEPRRDLAARARLLGLEDAPQRGRARRLHANSVTARCPVMSSRRGSACTRAAGGISSTRWSRSACSSVRMAPTATHRTRRSSSTARALLHRRDAGDGERAPVPVLELAHRGDSQRAAAKRGQARGDSFGELDRRRDQLKRSEAHPVLKPNERTYSAKGGAHGGTSAAPM